MGPSPGGRAPLRCPPSATCRHGRYASRRPPWHVPTSSPCVPAGPHRHDRRGPRWRSPGLRDQGATPRWRPAAARRWPPGSRRRRPPRPGPTRAILASLKVPPWVVDLTTSDTVIVPAQEAFLLDTRPASNPIHRWMQAYGYGTTGNNRQVASLPRERKRERAQTLVVSQSASLILPARPSQVLVEHRQPVGHRPRHKRAVAHLHRQPRQLVGRVIAHLAHFTGQAPPLIANFPPRMSNATSSGEVGRSGGVSRPLAKARLNGGSPPPSMRSQPLSMSNPPVWRASAPR